MFEDKYVSNHEICIKLTLFINKYDQLFPPIGELEVPPTKNQAEVYIISKWMYSKLSPHREYYINPQMFFSHCREELRYVSHKNIIILLNFLLNI